MSINIPYGRQSVSEEDIEYISKILKSDFLTQGPLVPKFENEVKNYCGAKYAVAANSATSSLHLACLALDVGPEDIVWTSAITFAASSNCALYCGASVDFVDIDEDTFNMCPIKLEEKLVEAKLLNKLPKVVIPVHMCGQSCDMESINILSKKFNFRIIEDASHAIGGSYKDNKIGSCKYSDITVFSFHPVKIITTGEGGMALTNIKEIASKISLYRSHGITREESLMEYNSDGPWYYEQIGLGFNYRMTDIHAALGISQFKRIDKFISKRHQIAERYNIELSSLPLKTPKCIKDAYSSFHLYVITIDIENIKISHRSIFNYLRGKGIGVNLHYMPVYKHPHYQKIGFKNYHCANSEKYYKTAISIPMFPDLQINDQDFVIQAIKDAFKEES